MPKIIRPPVIRDYFDPTQRETRTAIQGLTTGEIRKTTVRNVVLGTSTVMVPHQFGKIPTNWLIVDKNAQADVWRDATVAATNDFFPLRASATVTVAIQFWE